MFIYPIERIVNLPESSELEEKYLDFNEFKKAILNAGKKQWKN
jgi:hypothetical protein